MKLIMATVGAVLIALGAVGSVAATDNVRFEAELHHFSLPVGPCVDDVCDYVSYGYGFTNLMGPVTVTVEFTWDYNTTPCNTLDPLVFTMVGATGSITISGSGYICPGRSPYGFPQSVSIIGEITDATGEFSGIGGSVSAEGVIAQRGPVVHMTGTLSY